MMVKSSPVLGYIFPDSPTDCTNRSLARGCLGIALQMQGNTSRDSGRLNCYLKYNVFKILILTTAASLAIIPTINKRTRAFLFGGYSG